MSMLPALNHPPETATASSPAARRQVVSWGNFAWFGALVLSLYGAVLWGMIRDWFTNEEVVHGLLVPFVAGYIAWRGRTAVLGSRWTPSWWGVLFILWAIVQLMIGIVSADYFLARVSFLIAIAGVLWTAGGLTPLKTLAFPLILLGFMIRIPRLLSSYFILTIQLWGARIARFCLALCHIPAVQNQRFLGIAREQQIWPLEVCVGVTCFYSIAFGAVLYAYWFDRRPSMRLLFPAASVLATGIASVAATILAVLVSRYRPALVEHHYFAINRILTCFIAAALLIGVHRFLRTRAISSNLEPEISA